MKIWTLTTDADGIYTTVHKSAHEAEAALFANYDAGNEYNGDIQALLDDQGIAVYIDEHEVEL